MTIAGSDFDPVRLYVGVRNGEAAAEEQLIARFQPRVRAFLSVRTPNRDTVEELSQEIMVAVLCAFRDGKLREPQQLASFVYGTARNLFNDHIRKRAKEKLDPLPEDRDFPAPAAPLDEHDRFELARREIDGLEPTDRSILTMTLVQGMKPGEIASSLKLSSDVVRQRKSRALKKISERLNPASRPVVNLPLSQ